MKLLRKIVKIWVLSLVVTTVLNCNTNNLCSVHKDCPASDLCYSPDGEKNIILGNIGGCIPNEYMDYSETSKMFKGIRHCKTDADCKTCSDDSSETWGCLDKGGTGDKDHNCFLKKDGKYQDPIIKELWKKCPEK